MERTKILAGVKRVIVKVGTSTLTYETGKLNLTRIERLVRDIADLINRDKEVILVTSGAVGAGMGRLGLSEKPKTIPLKQAAAAVGQGVLMHIYEKLFNEYGQNVAQVLLTREDLRHRKRYLNARNTLLTLLEHRIVPIINENDTVAWEELKFGDNDTLSALVTSLVDADLLIILTDIDGLYTANPRTDPNATLIKVVEEVTHELELLAGSTGGTKRGTGGMYTKLQAARIAMNSGVPMVIAHGATPSIIQRIIDGEEIGTLFLPHENKLLQRKRWIAYGLTMQGKLLIDEGACRAIVHEGKSLLPSGIVEVVGSFQMGNAVSICRLDGEEVARGITNFSAEEIDKIKGRQTKEITVLLGYKDYDEVIHRDNLVVVI